MLCPSLTHVCRLEVADKVFSLKNVSERLQLKRTAMKQLDELANPRTIIASNSSSFTITEIIEGLELRHPRCCVNLHSCKCLNPSLKSLDASVYQNYVLLRSNISRRSRRIRLIK
jgi:hypothetical protein